MTAAIILAGGRAMRLGGAAKPQLLVDGATLLDHALAAVSGCRPLIVVGPPTPVHTAVVWTRESPPFGGPVAALAAGLRALAAGDAGDDDAAEDDAAEGDAAEVYVLAADVPRARAAVALLRQHPSLDDTLAPPADGVCLTDADGRMQWLIGRYRTASLRAALAGLPDGGRDASIRALLSGLTVTAVAGGDLAHDVDTWDDLERARAATRDRDISEEDPS